MNENESSSALEMVGPNVSVATEVVIESGARGCGGVECVYNPSGNREVCDACQSSLVITEDGFATCTNPKCSIIYKDTLDYSAEWRFYGADDNQMTDPTRCGMPVNPLLMESSYGCKVMCEGASSYEMRKIRRYTEWQSMPYAEKARYDEFERIKKEK